MVREDVWDMNRFAHPTHQRLRQPTDPMAYVARRLSSLPVVGGAMLAFVGAGLLGSAGLPGPTAIAAGLVGFVATATVINLAVGELTRHREGKP